MLCCVANVPVIGTGIYMQNMQIIILMYQYEHYNLLHYKLLHYNLTGQLCIFGNHQNFPSKNFPLLGINLYYCIIHKTEAFNVYFYVIIIINYLITLKSTTRFTHNVILLKVLLHSPQCTSIRPQQVMNNGKMMQHTPLNKPNHLYTM